VTSERRRRSIRLPDYDYAAASYYFVTICAHQKRPIFTQAAAATAVSEAWSQIPEHFSNVFVDEFVVMPNHVHGIIVIDEPVARRGAACCAPTPTQLRRPAAIPRCHRSVVQSSRDSTLSAT